MVYEYDSVSLQWICQRSKKSDSLMTLFSFLSCRIGDYVTMGGRVAVRDHVSIVSKVFAYIKWPNLLVA